MLIPRPFPPLATLMAMPWLRRLVGILAWAAIVFYFAFGILVLVLRHFVLPEVGLHRGEIETELSRALARPVTIRAVDARWHLFWPNLRIHGLEIRDAEGRPAFDLEEVEADVAWSSLWHLAPHFARLEIKAPRLDLRRDAEGRLFVAGLEIKTEDGNDAGFSEWLLAQDRIVIRDATLTWRDEYRRAPPLVLSRVNLKLRNRGDRHRFGLTAEPPPRLAARLDVRGELSDDDAVSLLDGKARLYAELDYAELSGWHAWVDYPLELPHGSGGLRLWLDLERGAVVGGTADLRMGRTIVRLAPTLPMLDLDRVDGRLTARRDQEGFTLQTRHLALATHNGIRLEPTDLDFHWQPGAAAHGEFSANMLDLGAMAALASYLPFNADVRERIVAYAPRGRVRDMQLAWVGESDTLSSYRIKTRFEKLGFNAAGTIPGFSGFDGTIDGNERGGNIVLASRMASLDFPAVFEQPSIPLSKLDANAEWTMRDGVVEVRLLKAGFQNVDAAGEASGRYRSSREGPGEIDLWARLTRADGGAVWRYMPLVVNEQVRNWLHESISGGAATASLRLKGDLKRFPFDDGSGVFEVKGPFQGATLRYAEGWPTIDNVTGDLLFSGSRMLIRAQKATVWGVQLTDVKAELADMNQHDQPLVVTGVASGPTADFLRFVESSPVAGYIGHVTDGMQATGDGSLRLRLDLPLNDIEATKVDGHLRVQDNRLVYDEYLPPISAINGELHFTEKSVAAKKVRALMFSAPLLMDIKTEDGQVALRANGSASVAALRQQYDQPLLDHLGGGTTWSATIQVKKHAAVVRVDSSLLGMSSSLPVPFNKTASEPLPLVFERKTAANERAATPDAQDQMDIHVGDVLRAQLMRRRTDRGSAVTERGLIAIGAPEARLPDRGVLLAVKAARVDADLWRSLGGGRGDSGFPIDLVDLRVEELRGFGRSIHDLRLSGRQENGNWKMQVDSREVSGDLAWASGDEADRLSGHVARLDIPDSDAAAPKSTATDPVEEKTGRLPSIDLTVDHFLMHGRELGQLRLEAKDTAGLWSTRYHIHNEDSQFEGTGFWRPAQSTSPAVSVIDFSLKTGNIEGTLERLGFSGAVRRGKAALTGQLSWVGAPTGIDYKTLGGKLTVEAERGQFKKLEPGVGRLLGILSLQSLPRRISLDFRDIFSEGFAFDSIDGNVAVNRGIMKTEDLEIDGPAATVLMNGTVDIVGETQDLKVRVQPTLGETVATGVLLINPVMGATAWVMNKVFGNPLDKVFAFDYAVTGSWDDPKVKKVAVQGPGLARPAENEVVP